MNKSTEIGALAEALSAAQGELTAAPFNAKNNFLGNEYADIGSFIDTAKPVLARNKLSVSQLVTSDEQRVGVTTILMHASGQWLESSVALEIGDEKGKSRAQVAGSIITYLRRYGYAGILGMYSGDEDDDGNGVKAAAPRTQAQKVTPVPVQKPAPKPAPVRTVMQDADRPMAPAGVKAWIIAKHDAYLNKSVPPGDTIEKMRGLATYKLSEWFGDDRRHWLLDALFGVNSSKALNYMQIAALLSYLALERGDDGKYHETANSDYAKAELTLMLEQYQIEQGQGTMELAA